MFKCAIYCLIAYYTRISSFCKVSQEQQQQQQQHEQQQQQQQLTHS